MAKAKKEKSPKVSKNSVLNDNALDIDIKSDDVEIVATDIDIKNEMVSDVAVIKNTASDEPTDSKTNVYDERVAKVLGEKNKDELTEKTTKQVTKKDELLTKKDELLSNVTALHESAKTDAENYKKSHKVKGLAGRLGVLGAYVGSLYQTQGKAFQAVDLEGEFDNNAVNANAFKQQGSQIASQLFGAKGATAQNLAKNFISDDKLAGLSNAVYGKLANWAKAWALKDLGNDSRFASLATLSDNERERLADEVVNQNRALATLGGATGFFGLKGVVVDTAWLLMVSLKSVYQLAEVYQKPLTGKDGVQLAYGILSKCNLDKLQEKQVLMTALALGNNVLVNAQSTSLADELKKIGEKYQNRSYAQGFELLSNYVNLDKLNFKGLRLLLPVASTAICAHYNNELIGEVLGVARATFQNKSTPMGLIEDKSAD